MEGLKVRPSEERWVVRWVAKRARRGRKKGGPVTGLQARAEAQTLTALAWHEAFHLASAPSNLPAQPSPAGPVLPACHIATINNPHTHTRTHATWRLTGVATKRKQRFASISLFLLNLLFRFLSAFKIVSLSLTCLLSLLLLLLFVLPFPKALVLSLGFEYMSKGAMGVKYRISPRKPFSHHLSARGVRS